VLEHSGLVRLRETYNVEIEWRGFQLHPEIPPCGAPLEALFGRRAAKLRSRVEAMAADFGVTLNAPMRAPSTVAPLAATERARELGGLDAFRDFLMDAYWRDGKDIEAPAVLREAAMAAGLDAESLAASASEDRYVSMVAAGRDQAMSDNVSAIPTLMVRGFPIVGCQRWETYEQVADKLGLERR